MWFIIWAGWQKCVREILRSRKTSRRLGFVNLAKAWYNITNSGFRQKPPGIYFGLIRIWQSAYR